MPAEIEEKKNLKKLERNESITCENLISVIAEQSETELKWVQLHQMFDR
tara:strand:+ start:2196 stop:2342 length:147 start_codon:yes stop_codon:yes gene_type:complete